MKSIYTHSKLIESRRLYKFWLTCMVTVTGIATLSHSSTRKSNVRSTSSVRKVPSPTRIYLSQAFSVVLVLVVPFRCGLSSPVWMLWCQLLIFQILLENILICIGRYYIIYVFQGAGLTGTRGNLIADCVQYVLNLVLTIPAIMKIDSWGRRPMLLIGTLLMGFWLCLVGGLQGHFGEWGIIDGRRVWVITGYQHVTKAVIVCSYLFVCSYAVTMGPVSWTVRFMIFWGFFLDWILFHSIQPRYFPWKFVLRLSLLPRMLQTLNPPVVFLSDIPSASGLQIGCLTLLSPG